MCASLAHQLKLLLSMLVGDQARMQDVELVMGNAKDEPNLSSCHDKLLELLLTNLDNTLEQELPTKLSCFLKEEVMN